MPRQGGSHVLYRQDRDRGRRFWARRGRGPLRALLISSVVSAVLRYVVASGSDPAAPCIRLQHRPAGTLSVLDVQDHTRDGERATLREVRGERRDGERHPRDGAKSPELRAVAKPRAELLD